MANHGWRRSCLLAAAFLCATALSLAVMGALPVSAQQAQATPDDAERTRSLDALFKSLKSVRGEEEADAVVEEIWRLWSYSGNPAADALMERGLAFLSISQLGAAHDQFTEALTMVPGFAEAWNKRATVRFMMNELEGALSDVEMVLALEPRHFGALAGRGMIHLRAGRWQQALEAYRQALAIHPFLKERTTIIPELERRVGEQPL